MGAEVAFDPFNANFRGIAHSDNLCISKIIHQSFIKVDENGTEASSAPVADATSKTFEPSVMQKLIEFKCKRPFIYVIHTAGNGILFMGKYVE
jgi:serpin B